MSIRQDGNLRRIPIVIVSRRELKVPNELSSGSTKGHGRVRIQIISASGGCVVVGLGIPHGPNEKVEIRIVRAGQPCGPTPLAPGVALPRLAAWLAWFGDRDEPPSLPSSLGIVGRYKALAGSLYGHTGDDEIAIGQWCAGDGVLSHVSRNRRFPLQGARRRRNGDESRVHRSEEYLVVEDCHAAICHHAVGRANRARERVIVCPYLFASVRFQRHHSARRLRDEHDAVPHDRRDLDVSGLAFELVNPPERESTHVPTIDLDQGAVAGGPVRTGVGEPVLAWLAYRRKVVVRHIQID